MTGIRYVGLDIHKRHVMVAAVNAQQELILKPTKVAVQVFDSWAQSNLCPSDHLGLEATSNAWAFYDQLENLVAKVVVANSQKIKLISASASKTDRQDALILAKLLAAKLLPAVWVPPQHVRDLRQLCQHRSQLVYERNSAKNRLHSILHQANLSLPQGNPFNDETWWSSLPLSSVDKLQVSHEWFKLRSLTALVDETEAMIAQLSVSPDWNDDMTFLIQLCGVGLYTGMTILAAIGEIQRFPSADQLVGYAGLGARVHDSGESHRSGKISKQGRRELRTALVTCAWSAVRWSPYWQEQFQQRVKRLGKNKAIVAIARRILVTIWHVLTKRELDSHADPASVARSLMTWASLHHLARSQGLHRLEFVKERLCRLGILEQVAAFKANGRSHSLAVAT